MSPPKVSVIVPIYKTPEYLTKCIDSIRNQSLKDIEIILVNDNSPDTLDDEICREYVVKDKRIVYIKHVENKGAGAARNTGLEIAKGDYVGFVDSDDYIHEDMYRIMYDKILSGGYSMVQCDMIEVGQVLKEKKVYQTKSDLVMQDKNFSIKSFFAGKLIMPSAWSKLFERSVIAENKIFFPSGVIYEDYSFMLEFLILCNKKYLIASNTLYYYFQRKSSISRTMRKKNIEDYFKLFQRIKKMLGKYSMYFEYQTSYRNFCKGQIINACINSYDVGLFDFFYDSFKESPFRYDKKLTVAIHIIYTLKRTKLYKFCRNVYRALKFFTKPFK